MELLKALKELIATLIVYFCFAFTIWQYNPSQWEESTRGMFIYCCIGASAIINIKKLNL